MWDKYHYYLNSPTKIEKLLWWDREEQNDMNKSYGDSLPYANNVSVQLKSLYPIKNCYPFVLKALNKEDYSCIHCPWFKFCPGCVIDPTKVQFVEVKPSMVLMIEWCSEIINQKEMTETNLKLILNHESVQGKEEDKSSKSIQECFSLFTEKENLGEDDKLYCSNCKIQMKFYKQLDFERLPPILITVLKRFKYTQRYVNIEFNLIRYKCKIDNLINFPISDLCLDSLKNQDKSYDLYGIIVN